MNDVINLFSQYGLEIILWLPVSAILTWLTTRGILKLIEKAFEGGLSLKIDLTLHGKSRKQESALIEAKTDQEAIKNAK